MRTRWYFQGVREKDRINPILLTVPVDRPSAVTLVENRGTTSSQVKADWSRRTHLVGVQVQGTSVPAKEQAVVESRPAKG